MDKITSLANVIAMNIRKTKFYQNLRTRGSKLLDLGKNSLKYSKLAVTGQLISFPMAQITDEFAFSLASEGWNFYSSVLSEYDQNPHISWDETTLFRFFNSESIKSVRSLNDLLFLHQPQKQSQSFQFYLGTWPWGGLTKADTRQGGTPFGWYYDQIEGKMTKELWGYGRNLWYEPGDRYTLEVETELTLKLYASVKKSYQPFLHLSFPSVTLLVRQDGEMRGLIVDGHHRLCILSHLNYEQVTVAVEQVIKETEVEQWFYVKQGYCQPEQALEIFQAFFDINGRERLDYLAIGQIVSCDLE